MHAGGGTNDRGEKRNVLIVDVLLLIGSNLSLRSNTQRRVQILRVRQAPVLLCVVGPIKRVCVFITAVPVIKLCFYY